MIGSRKPTKVLAYSEPVKMSFGFPGLIELIAKTMKEKPMSQNWYCFMNKKRNYIKILSWDGTGFCLWAKRLPHGMFKSFPGVSHGDTKSFSMTELTQLIKHVELKVVKGGGKRKVERRAA